MGYTPQGTVFLDTLPWTNIKHTSRVENIDNAIAILQVDKMPTHWLYQSDKDLKKIKYTLYSVYCLL